MEDWDEEVAKDRAGAARAAAIQFEAVKSHFRQSKEGVSLTLVLNPHDMPREIALSSIGQRFMCVLVPIDDHEQPILSADQRDVEGWIRNCGILCRDLEFQSWLSSQGLLDSLDGDACADAVRDFCRISSRTEFRTNPAALERWKVLQGAYVNGERL